MSATKIGYSKYKAFVEAHAKANPSLKKETQLETAQKLWNEVKNDQEKYSQMMIEFRSKAANLKSKLLNFWGRAAASNPVTNPEEQTPKGTYHFGKFSTTTTGPDVTSFVKHNQS